MKRKDLLKSAWTRLEEAGSFVLACHQRPDPDTLGSALALARVLRRRGKDVVVVSEDGFPEDYRFIPESETVVTSTSRRDFDVGMLVDCEGISRVGSAAEVIQAAKSTACVDHHMPDGEFGEIRVVDEEASSTAEVVVELFDANAIEIDKIAATQLLAGLTGDTGAFRFANTTAHTFRTAARLTDLGAEPSAIAHQIFESKPLKAVKLLGKALCTVETDPDGLVVWATITWRDLDDLQATDEDSDGIVNQVSAVRGPKVALLFRELEQDRVRVSLRSRDGVDVNQVARVFGGGGHIAAAGCTVELPLDEARKRVVEEVLKWTAS